MNGSTMMQYIILTGMVLFGFYKQIHACNEAVCGSIVSKCLLTQSCKCELENCTCCKECFNCLSYLYAECCSCVNMCPKPNDTEQHELSRLSYVEDITVQVPSLFKLLTDSPDPEKRWETFTYPVDYNFTHLMSDKEMKMRLQDNEQEVIPLKPGSITLNCTVAFMATCTSMIKCRSTCQSMSAFSFRWFHDGCCECVGEYCINYGINQSRCDCSDNLEDNSIIDSESDFLEYEDETENT